MVDVRARSGEKTDTDIVHLATNLGRFSAKRIIHRQNIHLGEPVGKCFLDHISDRHIGWR